jgi:hypothetical protein
MHPEALSSDVNSGSREENATKQRDQTSALMLPNPGTGSRAISDRTESDRTLHLFVLSHVVTKNRFPLSRNML